MFFKILNFILKINGDWGLGIGDWGLGIGPNPHSPIPNPPSPIPNPQSPIILFNLIYYNLKNFLFVLNLNKSMNLFKDKIIL